MVNIFFPGFEQATCALPAQLSLERHSGFLLQEGGGGGRRLLPSKPLLPKIFKETKERTMETIACLKNNGILSSPLNFSLAESQHLLDRINEYSKLFLLLTKCLFNPILPGLLNTRQTKGTYFTPLLIRLFFTLEA